MTLLSSKNRDEVVHSYRCDKRGLYILIGVSAMCMVWSALAMWMAFDRYQAPPSALDEMGFGESARKDSLVVGGGIGLFNLIVSFGCAAAAWFQNSVRVDIYDDGFVSRRGSRTYEIVWGDVSSVNEHKFVSRPEGRQKSVRYYVVVHTHSGEEILLRGIEHVRGVGERIARQAGVELVQVTD